MLEEKKTILYKYSLVVSNNFLKKFSFFISSLFLYFVMKGSSKFSVIFFFILAFILLGLPPKVLKKKKRLKMVFLGFCYKNGLIHLYNLVLIYLPILNVVSATEINFINKETY
jgi:hypothetical protein